MKFIEDGFVYEKVELSNGMTELRLVGMPEFSQIEGDDKVYYTFDEKIGDYVETGREPYTPPAPEPDPIYELQLAVAELAEAMEQDKTDIQLAIVELADLINGGDE